jgi:hypothetical protein
MPYSSLAAAHRAQTRRENGPDRCDLISRGGFALEESLATTSQKPVGIDPGHLDETKDRVRGDGEARLVMMQCAKRDPKSFSQDRASIFAVKRHPNLTNSHREVAFQGLPFRFRTRTIHGLAAVFNRS